MPKKYISWVLWCELKFTLRGINVFGSHEALPNYHQNSYPDQRIEISIHTENPMKDTNNPSKHNDNNT